MRFKIIIIWSVNSNYLLRFWANKKCAKIGILRNKKTGKLFEIQMNTDTAEVTLFCAIRISREAYVATWKCSRVKLLTRVRWNVTKIIIIIVNCCCHCVFCIHIVSFDKRIYYLFRIFNVISGCDCRSHPTTTPTISISFQWNHFHAKLIPKNENIIMLFSVWARVRVSIFHFSPCTRWNTILKFKCIRDVYSGVYTHSVHNRRLFWPVAHSLSRRC